jgi:dihydroorotate dehydrogenase
MYRWLFRVALRSLPAEATHTAAVGFLRAVMAIPLARYVARWFTAPRAPELRVQALGLDFPGPVGLAAGFDKSARAYRALGAIGFAFVEVGTVTARPQPGNPKPRLFRLPEDRALVNRLGFNNDGAAAVAGRLAARRDVVVGVNIGKSKAATADEIVADYVKSAELLGPRADYLVVNVSSPNTPGLRDLQAVPALRPLLLAVRAALDRSSAARRVPLLVKISPDLSDDDTDAVADLALELGLDGIIATNTTLSRDDLRSPPSVVEACGPGGLSGAPLKARALEVLRRLRARAGERLVLVAAGGVETADDAWERIRAGATLVQTYTGFVYGGPLAPRTLHRGVLARLRAAGFASVHAAIGSGQREPIGQAGLK